MKKIITTLAIAVFISIGHAQDNTKTRFAVLGGINFQNLNGKNYLGEKLDNKMIVGFHLGVNADIPLADEFYFRPGLLFTTKGAKAENNNVTNTLRVSYLEMPLNFVYKGALGSGFVMLGFGPYIAYGIKGKSKVENNGTTNTSDVRFKNEVETTDPQDKAYMKPFDAGANIFAGYEFGGGLFFQLNTQLGLLNISPEYKSLSNDKSMVKNTGFGLSAGYRF